MFLDSRGIRAYPVFDVHRGAGGRDGRYTFPRESKQPGYTLNRYRVPEDGELVGAAGHLHPGGLWTDLVLERGRRSGCGCSARDAKYFEPAGAVSWDVAMEVTPPDWRVGGQARRHPRRCRRRTTPSARRGTRRWGSCRPRSTPAGRGPDPFVVERRLHGRGHARAPAREPQPRRRVLRPAPTRGGCCRRRRRRSARSRSTGFLYGRGDLLRDRHAAAPADDPARRHAEVRQPRRAGEGSCTRSPRARRPATRTTGIAYPLANGKVRFDSGNLGFGPRGRHRRGATAPRGGRRSGSGRAPTPTSAGCTRSCAARSASELAQSAIEPVGGRRVAQRDADVAVVAPRAPGRDVDPAGGEVRGERARRRARPRRARRRGRGRRERERRAAQRRGEPLALARPPRRRRRATTVSPSLERPRHRRLRRRADTPADGRQPLGERRRRRARSRRGSRPSRAPSRTSARRAGSAARRAGRARRRRLARTRPAPRRRSARPRRGARSRARARRGASARRSGRWGCRATTARVPPRPAASAVEPSGATATGRAAGRVRRGRGSGPQPGQRHRDVALASDARTPRAAARRRRGPTRHLRRRDAVALGDRLAQRRRVGVRVHRAPQRVRGGVDGLGVRAARARRRDARSSGGTR